MSEPPQHQKTSQTRRLLGYIHHKMHAQEFKLVSDTLFLGVSCIDRFLSVHPIPRQQLQLVGVTCMLLASKYEEIYAPTVSLLAPAALYLKGSGITQPCQPWQSSPQPDQVPEASLILP